MTVSDLDRPHSRLSRLEGVFPGCHAEIVEGGLMTRLRVDLETQLPAGGSLVTDAAFPFEQHPPRLRGAATTRCRDYEVKPRWYASRGIADHLVLDPLCGQPVTMWNPGPDCYRGRDTLFHGSA